MLVESGPRASREYGSGTGGVEGGGEGGEGKMAQGEGRRVGDAGEPGEAVGAAEAAEEVGEGMWDRRREEVRVLGGLLSSGTKG